MANSGANYDISKLFVDPHGLEGHSKKLHNLAGGVVDSIENIAKTLADLKLAWVGQTADEAKEFGDRWNAVMKDLFGSKGSPKDGVLNAVTDDVLKVAGLFATTEDALRNYFTQFGAGLEGGSTGSGKDTPRNRDQIGRFLGDGTPIPEDVTNPDETAVTEKWS